MQDYWCAWWDLNPHGQRPGVFKTPMYTDSITRAKKFVRVTSMNNKEIANATLNVGTSLSKPEECLPLQGLEPNAGNQPDHR